MVCIGSTGDSVGLVVGDVVGADVLIFLVTIKHINYILFDGKRVGDIDGELLRFLFLFVSRQMVTYIEGATDGDIEGVWVGVIVGAES